MFAEMLKKIMYPLGRDKVHCLGKGGNEGRRYMLERAIEMLRAQGHDGDRSKIMIIGDRFDTDIRGGRSVGIKTCLVESGCHTSQLQQFYPADTAHFVAPGAPSSNFALTRRPPARPPSSFWACDDRHPHGQAACTAATLIPTAAATDLRAILPEPEDSQHGLLPHFVDKRLMLRAWMLSQGNMIYANNTNGQVPESLRRLLREYFDFVTNLGGLLGSHNPMRTVATATVVEAPLSFPHSPHCPCAPAPRALSVGPRGAWHCDGARGGAGAAAGARLLGAAQLRRLLLCRLRGALGDRARLVQLTLRLADPLAAHGSLSTVSARQLPQQPHAGQDTPDRGARSERRQLGRVRPRRALVCCAANACRVGRGDRTTRWTIFRTTAPS